MPPTPPSGQTDPLPSDEAANVADVDPEVSGHAADVEKGRQVGGGGVPEPGCVAPGSGRARHTRTLPNDARESGDRRPVSAPSGRSASALTTSQGLRPTPAGSDRRPHAPAPFSTTGTSPRVPRRGTCTGACPGEAASTTPGPGFNDADVTVRGFNDAFEVVGQCRWRTPRIRPTPNTGRSTTRPRHRRTPGTALTTAAADRTRRHHPIGPRSEHVSGTRRHPPEHRRRRPAGVLPLASAG